MLNIILITENTISFSLKRNGDDAGGQWRLAENQFPGGAYPDFFSRFPTEDFRVSNFYIFKDAL